MASIMAFVIIYQSNNDKYILLIFLYFKKNVLFFIKKIIEKIEKKVRMETNCLLDFF